MLPLFPTHANASEDKFKVRESAKCTPIFLKRCVVCLMLRLKDWPHWGQLVNSHISSEFSDENNNFACESERAVIGCLGSHSLSSCCESTSEGVSCRCADRSVDFTFGFLAGAFQLSNNFTPPDVFSNIPEEKIVDGNKSLTEVTTFTTGQTKTISDIHYIFAQYKSNNCHTIRICSIEGY